jgi:hypothetical protein
MNVTRDASSRNDRAAGALGASSTTVRCTSTALRSAASSAMNP